MYVPVLVSCSVELKDQHLRPFGPPLLSGSPAAACFEHVLSWEKEKKMFQEETRLIIRVILTGKAGTLSCKCFGLVTLSRSAIT